MCGIRAVLPTSCTPSSPLTIIGRQPIALTSSGDLYEGRTLEGSKVRINRVRVCSQEGPTLYQTAVAWKRLEHQSIVPLLGVTSSPLQFISEWMPGGDLTGYINKYPDADRISLVGDLPPVLDHHTYSYYQLYDVTEGLRFLHSHNMVHGDLKGVRGHSKSVLFPR